MTTMAETTDGEYWLLTVVCEHWLFLHALSKPERDIGLNLSSPDLWGDQLIDTLHHLFQRGDVIAQQMGEGPGNWLDEVGSPFVPSRSQIEAAVGGRLSLVYGLTPQGAARWELVANPQWDRYFVDSWGYDPDQGEIIASDPELVERLLTASPYIWKDDQPIEKTVSWETVQPWQATYWKLLPTGHRLTFDFRRTAPDPQSKRDANSLVTEARFHGWWSAINAWYIRPMAHARPWHERIWRARPASIDRPTQADRERDKDLGAHWHSVIRLNDREFSQHVFFRVDEDAYRMRLFRYDTGVFLGEEVWMLSDGTFPNLEAAIRHVDNLVASATD